MWQYCGTCNMAVPLIECTKDQRSVIRFLLSEGVELVKCMKVIRQCGGNCVVRQRKIYGRMAGKIQRRVDEC
jgi:hypothetical protein